MGLKLLCQATAGEDGDDKESRATRVDSRNIAHLPHHFGIRNPKNKCSTQPRAVVFHSVRKTDTHLGYHPLDLTWDGEASRFVDVIGAVVLYIVLYIEEAKQTSDEGPAALSSTGKRVDLTHPHTFRRVNVTRREGTMWRE